MTQFKWTLNRSLKHAVVLFAVASLGTACTSGGDTDDDAPEADAGTQQPDGGNTQTPDSGDSQTDSGTETPDGGDSQTPDGGDSQTPDSGTVQTKARLTVNWSIKNVDGTAVGCGTQYTKVKVHAQAFTTTASVRTGDPFTKMFDCAAGTGTFELPTSGDADTGGFSATDINGKFDVWITQTESSGELKRQVSLTTYQVDLRSGDKTVTTALYENGGYRLVGWSLKAQSTGDLITCAASGVDTLELVSENEATHETKTDRFPCSGHPYIIATGFGAQGASISSPLVAGSYTFTVRAYSNNTLVGTGDPETEEEVRNLSRVNDVEDTHFVTITTR